MNFTGNNIIYKFLFCVYMWALACVYDVDIKLSLLNFLKNVPLWVVLWVEV